MKTLAGIHIETGTTQPPPETPEDNLNVAEVIAAFNNEQTAEL